MKLEFREYEARRVVNVHRHVDGPWFWGKYTAHPYVGCRSGCEFCYSRGGLYLGRRDPDTFDTLIQVKVNAADLMRKEMAQLPQDILACGDWQQPAETRYGLSRRMLEVVRDLRFPLFIVERSPLVARDLDLLTEINQQSWVGVQFSISYVDPTLKRCFEPHSPGIRQRLRAMERIAGAGILVGAALMPILPLVGDDEKHLHDTIRATKEHGGSFVVAGGLTMDGLQAERTLSAARRLDPLLEAQWRELYGWPVGGRPAYSPARAYNARLGLKVRELCARHGLLDRMPRYVAQGPLAVNKRVAERLFLQTYELELEEADDRRIWAYRKAAWTVDEWPESVATIYQARGEAGLRTLPSIGESLAKKIAEWLRQAA
jgi:DNA repair photolyase